MRRSNGPASRVRYPLCSWPRTLLRTGCRQRCLLSTRSAGSDMTDAGQHLGAKQPHRFHRLLSAETGPGETEVDDSNSGGLVEVGDLLNHLVRAAAKLQRAEGEADSTLVGRGILAVGLGAHCNW